MPEAIRRLPFLPSIESAYAQGYRRLIYQPSYTEPELLLKYSEDALLICGTFGADVMSVFMSTMRAGGGTAKEEALLGRVVAIAATTPFPSNDGIKMVADLYLANQSSTGKISTFDEIEQFLIGHLVARWQDGLADLLDSGIVSVDQAKTAFPRSRNIEAFLTGYLKQKTPLAAS